MYIFTSSFSIKYAYPTFINSKDTIKLIGNIAFNNKKYPAKVYKNSSQHVYSCPKYTVILVIFLQLITYPKDIDIITYLASFFEKEGRFEKAFAVLKKGLEESVDNTSLLFKLGAVQDKAGLKDESILTMEKIIQLDPEDAGALNYLGYTYADKGIHLDEALALIQKANELKPDDGYIVDSLGWVYYKRGDYNKAVEYLEKAAELTSFETIIADHLGDAYQKTDRLKDALETYKKALSNAGEDNKDIVIQIQKKIKTMQKQFK